MQEEKRLYGIKQWYKNHKKFKNLIISKSLEEIFIMEF